MCPPVFHLKELGDSSLFTKEEINSCFNILSNLIIGEVSHLHSGAFSHSTTHDTKTIASSHKENLKIGVTELFLSSLCKRQLIND